MPAVEGDVSDEHHRPLAGGRWQVRLFGGLELRNGDVVLTRFASRPVLLLFARLALAPRSAHSREQLGQWLWPDVAGESAAATRRERLRRALFELRRQLEPAGALSAPALLADRLTVRLNGDLFEFDTAQFEAQVAGRRWATALETYRGDLLPGVEDAWVQDQRARLCGLLNRIEDATPASAADDDDAAVAPAVSRRPVVPYVTPFFGRGAEIRGVAEAVASRRVVTISGPGGCGKTRLAAQAVLAIGGFDPVVWVALAECARADDLLEVVRAALGLQAGPQPPLERIVGRLAGRKALLVLDNFEQLVGAPADGLLDTLLARVPGLQLLVTSRRALRRADELEHVLAPLPLPPAGAGPVALAREPAVALFVDRARAARADFSLHARNAAAVGEICRVLEGLPLAIELAAAKVRSHAPREMLRALLTDRSVLARRGPKAKRAARHASLQAALDWSWSLLGEPERTLARGLTVLRDGWTPAQALAVAGRADGGAALAALARDSLVQARPGAPGRFGMLAMVREYLADQVDAAEASTLRQRHRAHFLALALELDARHEWPADGDLSNLVAAIGSALADHEAGTALTIALALKGYFSLAGASPQAMDWLLQTARAASLAPLRRAPLLALCAVLLVRAGRVSEAREAAAQAVAAADRQPQAAGEALYALAAVHWMAGRDGASALPPALEARRHAQASAAAPLEARVLLLLGAIRLEHEGEVAHAARLFEAAERMFTQQRDRHASALALPGRVACLIAEGRLRQAIGVAAAGERLADELGDRATQQNLFSRLSVCHEGLREFERALEVCQRQAGLARDQGMLYHLAFAAWNQCRPLARLRRPEAAARLMAFSVRLWTEQFGALGAEDERYVRRVRGLVEAQLGVARWPALWAEGAALSLKDGIDAAAGRICP